MGYDPDAALSTYSALPSEPSTSESDSEDIVSGVRPLEWENSSKPLSVRAHKWWTQTQKLFFEKKRHYSWVDWLCEFLPCIAWLRQYDMKACLLADLLAGLSVACMVVPQGMSYASLAGLPSVFGIYGATVPGIVFCLFGSSRQLAIGPIAVSSMLVGAGLTEAFGGHVNHDPNDPDDPQLQSQYNQAAVQVAFLVGLVWSCVGLLRLGWVTNFLSRSVVSGFMSGASLVISLSQVKYLLGLQLPRSDRLQDTVRLVVENIDKISLPELVMGSSFMFILVAFKLASTRNKRLTFLNAVGPLTVCTLSILLMSLLHLYELPSPKNPYIKAVGAMQGGLPPVSMGWWLPLRFPETQIILAVAVCLVDAVEAVSMAKSLALKNRYEVDATQDFKALGLANLAGSAFSCYNSTGSLSRSAVNNDVGAKTPLATGFCGVLLLFALMFITPLLSHMSKNVQGAIIIVGVLRLFDWRECVFLFKVNKPDWVVWMVAFLVTALVGVVRGIAVSVVVALLMVIHKSAFPRIATLGRLSGTEPGLYRNRKMYPTTLEEPGMLLLRIDAPLYFANCMPVKEGIRKAVRKARRQRDIQYVILDLSPVTDIDATAIHFLDTFLDELKSDGLHLALVNPSHQVVMLLRRSRLHTKVGMANIHVSMHDAVGVSRHELEGAALQQLKQMMSEEASRRSQGEIEEVYENGLGV